VKLATWLALLFLCLSLLAGCGGGGGGSSGARRDGTILYVANGYEVHLLAPDGSEMLYMISGYTRISPDGRSIVYCTDSGTGSTFVSEVWIRGLDSPLQKGSKHRVFESSTLAVKDCSMSYDGNRIAFAACGIQTNGPRELYVVNVDGTDLHQLTHGSSGMGRYRPSFSPDGSKIIYESGGAIEIMNADGSGATPLCSGCDPCYSPDGAEVVFSEGGLIWIIDADGNNRRQVPQVPECAPTPLSARCPNFSPDGTRIVFVGGREEYFKHEYNKPVFRMQTQVYVMDIDGSHRTQMTLLAASHDIDECSWGGSP